MAGTRWPGRVGSQGRGDDNRRKLGLGGWGTHQVVVLGTGRLKSSPQVQRRTVLFQKVPIQGPARKIWNSQVMGI